MRVKEKKASIDEIFYSTIFLNIKFLVVILRIILLPHDYEELPVLLNFHRFCNTKKVSLRGNFEKIKEVNSDLGKGKLTLVG